MEGVHEEEDEENKLRVLKSDAAKVHHVSRVSLPGTYNRGDLEETGSSYQKFDFIAARPVYQ